VAHITILATLTGEQDVRLQKLDPGDFAVECGPAANKFGEFIVKILWDKAIQFHDLLDRGHWKAPLLQQLQKDLAALTPKEREIVRRCVVQSLGVGLHDFLLALGEAHDFKKGIAVVVDGIDIVEQSDGLHGESFGPDVWMAKYSKHPEGYPEFKT
jgi:hypothetical protein